MNSKRIIEISKSLLKPYRIPKNSPYLSEEQRYLSTLTLKKRIASFGEWFFLVNSLEKYSKKDRK